MLKAFSSKHLKIHLRFLIVGAVYKLLEILKIEAIFEVAYFLTFTTVASGFD